MPRKRRSRSRGRDDGQDESKWISRRGAILLAGGVASVAALRPSFAFSNTNADRDSNIDVSSDADGLLQLIDFSENPGSVYQAPHDVTVTNQTNQTLDGNNFVTSQNGALQFRDPGSQSSTQTLQLSTSGLSPGSSTTFEIVTGPSSTGQVTDTVTIHFESSSDLSVDVTRDITVDFNASNTSVVASPAGPNQTAEHTWKAPGYTTGGPEVNTIALDYSGTGTNFGNVNSGNVTVTLTRTLSSGLDRSTINVTSGGSSFGGETALIDLSGTYTTDVVDDPNGNPNIKLAVANVGNPSSAGVFQATIDFNLSNGTTDSFDAELEIVNTPRFDVTITSAPNEIFKGDTFDIEYEVANNGTKPDTQDIELAINGVVEQTNGSVNLNANQTLSAKTGNTPTFTLNESNLSQSPPYSIEIKSADTTASQVVSVVVPNDFSLTANPTTPNTSSTHTWKATETDFTGEVDTITVDYPSGFDFSGLNETDMTVTMERQLGSGPSTDNIPVNSGTYSGTSATFDLSGSYNTDLIGLLEVEIAGITNASTGTYSPTITLNGANDTVSDTIGALDIQ